MINVLVKDDLTSNVMFGLWQYDYGQKIRFSGIDLPQAVEVHFSYKPTGDESVTRIGTTSDGVTEVAIPDSFLEQNKNADYNFYTFIYVSDGKEGKTVLKTQYVVKARPKPEVLETPEQEELFQETINVVNQNSEIVKEVGTEVKANLEKTTQLYNNFKTESDEYSNAFKDNYTKSVQTIDEKTQKVEKLSSEALNDIGTKEQAVIKNVSAAQTVALNEIKTSHTSALDAISKARSSSTSDIEALRTKSINDVNALKEQSVKAVSDTRDSSLSSIKKTTDTSLESIENAKQKAISDVKGAFFIDDDMCISVNYGGDI